MANQDRQQYKEGQILSQLADEQDAKSHIYESGNLAVIMQGELQK